MKFRTAFFYFLYMIFFLFPFLRGAYGDDYNFLLHFCVVLLLAIFFLYVFFGGNLQRWNARIFAPYGFFLLFLIPSVVFSISRHESIKEFYLIVDDVLIFFMLAFSPLDARDVKNLFLTQIVASACLSSFALYQILYSFPHLPENPLARELMLGKPQRAFSTFIHPNIFGSYLAMCNLLLLGYYKICKGWIERHLLNAVFVLNSLAMGLTFSYGVWAVFIGALVLYVFFSTTRKKDFYHLCFAVLAVAAVGAVFIQKTRNTNFDIPRDVMLLTNKETKKASFSGRLSFWKSSLRAGVRYPFYGSGFRTFKITGMMLQGDAVYSMYPHNLYLQLFCETGFFGLFGFLWLLCYSFIRGKRSLIRMRSLPFYPLCAAMFLCLLFFYAHSFIDFDWNIPYLPFFIFSLTGVLFSFSQRAEEGKLDSCQHVQRPSGAVSRWLLLACFMGVFLYLGLGALNTFYAYHNFQKAYSLSLRRDYQQAERMLYKIQNPLRHEASFHGLYAKVYEGMGDFKNAERHADEAVHLDPMNVSYFGESAQIDLEMRQLEKAKSNLRHALTLCPFCVDYMYGLAQIALMEGKTGEAKRVLDNALKIFSAYERVGSVHTVFLHIFLLYGDICDKERDSRKAKMYYKMAEKFFPGNEEVKKRLVHLR